MKQPDIQDQTQFMTESPLYEQPLDEDLEAQKKTEPMSADKKNKKKKILIIASSIIVILLISLLVIFYLNQEKPDNSVGYEDDKPIDKAISGPLEQRVEELSQELELADPNQQKLPFPLVDKEITLEE